GAVTLVYEEPLKVGGFDSSGCQWWGGFPGVGEDGQLGREPLREPLRGVGVSTDRFGALPSAVERQLPGCDEPHKPVTLRGHGQGVLSWTVSHESCGLSPLCVVVQSKTSRGRARFTWGEDCKYLRSYVK